MKKLYIILAFAASTFTAKAQHFTESLEWLRTNKGHIECVTSTAFDHCGAIQFNDENLKSYDQENQYCTIKFNDIKDVVLIDDSTGKGQYIKIISKVVVKGENLNINLSVPYRNQLRSKFLEKLIIIKEYFQKYGHLFNNANDDAIFDD